MTDDMRHLHLRTAGLPVRTATYDGREHLVIPVIALREGVIHAVNAETPEFVSAKMLAQAAHTWNGRALVLGHPTRDGRQISANEPGVIDRQGFGTIFASKTNGTNLGMEAWVDPKRLEALGQQSLLADLRAGKTIEVSVGAHVRTLNKVGQFNGKAYKAEWGDIVGDHLAFLPGGRGACSVAMGCGTHRAASEGPIVHDFSVKEEPMSRKSTREKLGDLFHALRAIPQAGDLFRAMRDIPQSKRDMMKDSDFAGPDQSFPIAKPEDVEAASHLIGKAKNPDAVKARIIAIAKRKGADFVAKLPEKWRAAAAYDTPSEAASEEAAELIAYQTMRELMDAVGNQWDTASGIVDDLVSDEEDDPTESAQDEAAEEEVETARMESLCTLVQSMTTALYAVSNLCYKELAPEPMDVADPRYAEMRAAIGKKISAATMKTIQSAHDSAHDMHNHTVALGADCNGMKVMADRAAAKPKMTDCSVCDGTGQVDGEDCSACDGTGEVPIKAAEANEGGASADSQGDTYMTKEQRAEKIKALAACDCSGFKGDAKTLETLSDERLEAIDVRAAETRELRAAAAKPAEKPEIKALTEAELVAALPPAMRRSLDPAQRVEAIRKTELVAKLKTAQDVRKTELVAKLKTAQDVHTEDELKALGLDELEKIARFTKIDAPIDYSGRGMPVQRTAEQSDVYSNPPDPWSEANIKAAAARGRVQ